MFCYLLGWRFTDKRCYSCAC